MMIRMIGQNIRIAIRSKEIVIWTLIFPIMMSTLFYFAFGALDQANQLERIPIAVVEDAAYEQAWGLAPLLEELSSGEEALLTLEVCPDEDQAAERLTEGAVDGYIRVNGGMPELVVSRDGMNQTIVRQVLTRYVQMRYSAKNGAVPAEREPISQAGSLTHNPPSEMMVYFYALLAMVCLFGSFQGVTGIYNLQANQSAVGARCNMAPVPYFRTVLASIIGGALLHTLIVWVSLAYMAFVLQINFGGRLLLAALGCGVGSLLGVSMGVLLGSIPKMGLQAKIGFSVGITLLCCFCAGMMFSGINYWLMQHLPAVSWLNPAARLTDALYSLYYYDTLQPFVMNVGIMLLFSAAAFAVSAVIMRRYRYESI